MSKLQELAKLYGGPVAKNFRLHRSETQKKEEKQTGSEASWVCS
jgi:hypothetical protein